VCVCVCVYVCEIVYERVCNVMRYKNGYATHTHTHTHVRTFVSLGHHGIPVEAYEPLVSFDGIGASMDHAEALCGFAGCVCACVCEREIERGSVCVCVCVFER
jgi:hypothetical protein